MPARNRARSRPAVDRDGRIAHARAPGRARPRRAGRERRGPRRRRARRTARCQRTPPAPHLPRGARRHAVAVPADAAPASREATADRYAPAGRPGRLDERLSQPAPLQRRVRRQLPDEPGAPAQGRGRDERAARRSRAGGDRRPRPPRSVRHAGTAAIPVAARDSRRRDRRRPVDPAQRPRRHPRRRGRLDRCRRSFPLRPACDSNSRRR